MSKSRAGCISAITKRVNKNGYIPASIASGEPRNTSIIITNLFIEPVHATINFTTGFFHYLENKVRVWGWFHPGHGYPIYFRTGVATTAGKQKNKG